MPGEFEIIDRYFKRKNRRKDVVKSIGDDAAVLRTDAEKDLVVTVDTLVEGVHFPLDTDPEAIGFKSLAVNLSDLAAMGAVPAWFTLSLTLPCVDESWLQGFASGLFESADRYGIDLVGGDTTHGPLCISITAMGFTSTSKALCRNGARVGDAIFVTGYIGDAALGLAAKQGKISLEQSSLEYCLSRLNRPSPRLDAGRMLLNIASAAIDISDGLAADLSHILNASAVGARLQLTSIPRSKIFVEACAYRPEWRMVVAGGDDYELLFTVPQSKIPRLIQAGESLGCGITRIGQIERQPGLRIDDTDGREVVLASAGYQHFDA
ncbi:MAG: thiamine-phosphate kinase [Gammaproteobacteria bacterium]|nr:thiamine-phosphate kinase [Gammaproteobacteria bacterium]